MIVEMMLAGFLFLFLIIMAFAGEGFGTSVEQTLSDLDSDAKLQKINKDPKKFKISIVLALIDHVSVISIAVLLFFAFSPVNITLGITWVFFRTGEGLIQIYNKKNYWRLLSLARQYSGTNGAEKITLIELGRSILKTKNSSWISSQILFSIGTLAYSILFVTYGDVPTIIGWLGIVASILFGFGSAIILVKPNFKVLQQLGGLSALIFEIALGGWLLLSPLI